MDSLRRDVYGKYLLYTLNMFLKRYAEHAYPEAAVWGRKMAEAYCIAQLKYFQRYNHFGFHGLAELAWELPQWVWGYSAYEHVSAFGEEYMVSAVNLGMHLSSVSIYDDLTTLRQYGNTGAHAGSYFSHGRLGADPDVFAAAVRVAMSFVPWCRRCSRF